MGMENEKNIKIVSKVTVVIVALAMILPVGIILAGAEPSEAPIENSAPVTNTFYQQNDIVNLANARYDVNVGPQNLPGELMISQYDARVNGYYLVKFDGAIDQVWIAELKAMGATIGSYVPYNTYMVKMDADTMAEVNTLPFVRNVDIYQPAFKFQKHILDGVQLTDGLSVADSLDYLKWTNLYEQAKAIGQDEDRLVVNIQVHNGENPHNLGALIVKLGGELLGVTENSVRAEVSRPGIQNLAFVNNVEYIAPHYMHELMLADTGWTEQSKVSGSTPVWDANIDGYSDVDGAAVVIGVSDTGLNTDHEQFRDPGWAGASDWTGSSPTHRKVVGYHQLGDNNLDYDGHGSHVSGLAVGNGDFVGSANVNRFGMAFEAKISFCDVGYSDDGSGTNDVYLSGIPQDLKDLYALTQGDGATIHTNSWGIPCWNAEQGTRTMVEGTYTEDSTNSDWFMWLNKNYQVLFSAGNDRDEPYGTEGPYTRTVTPPATAKNIISVGVHCSGASWDDTTAYSSWGPTLDGRLKPDISATGDGLFSWDGQESASNDNNRDGLADTTYVPMQGTSMSSPVAAGDLALISQYYRDGYYPVVPGESPVPANGFEPSAALMKATMINGAMDAPSGNYPPDGEGIGNHPYVLNGFAMDYPNNDIGWGMVDLDSSLYFDGDALEMWIDDNTKGMITDQYREYKFNAWGTQPLEITVVWTDFYGSPATDGALVNDLDLTVTDPLGTIYIGNNYGASSRESVSPGLAGYDHTNNVECVLVKAPIPGEWTITINATNVLVGPQPYGLVVTGDFDEGYGWVKFDKFTYASGDTVSIEVEDINVITGSLDVQVTSTTGDVEIVTCNEVALNARRFIGTIDLNVLTPIPGDNSMGIEDGGTITATYSDANPIHDSICIAETSVTGPAISDVYVSDISNVGAIVHWTTDVPSNSQVYYGETAALGSITTLDVDMVLLHSVPIIGLSAFTNYYFDVESTSIGEITTRDTNGGTHYMFTTVDNPDVLIIQEHSDITSSEQQVDDWRLSLGYYGWSFTVWETVKFGLPSLAAMNSAKLVYWDVGEGYPQLGGEERALIQTWVGQAGQQKFYVTGQDIGWGMYEYPESPPDPAWYMSYMHATFLQDDTDGGGGDEVAGQCWLIGTAHEISNVFPGNGGTQDLEQDIYGPVRFWPDDIRNDQGGDPTPPWDYNLHAGGGDAAGIAYDGADYKLAYEAFAHAQIQDDGTYVANDPDLEIGFGYDLNMDRATIADNTIIWLLGEDHPDITVTYPDGGDTITGTDTVTWDCGADPSGGFEVQISRDGGQSYVVDGTAIPTARTYSWDTTTGAPLDYPNGDNYRVKIVGYGAQLVGFDVSDNDFTVDNGGDGDDLGPVLWAGSVGVTPIPVGQSHPLNITATADDRAKGNSEILKMEVYIDGTAPGDYVGDMTPTDGDFNSPLEDGFYIHDTTLDAFGTHTVSVRAQDAAFNWGAFQTTDYYVVIGPPVIDLLTPTTDEIIDGAAYDITWLAEDVNMDNNLIDIKLEYSDNGGGSWTTLLDIPTNPDTYSWDTTGLTDGVNYLIRITAKNDAELTEVVISEPFSVDNTADDQWFLQVEASGIYRDLDMKPVKPVKTTENTVETGILNSVESVLVGTWETPTSPYTDISGPWTFNIHGHVDVVGPLEGYLYAVVKDGTGLTLDTSIFDDEDINGFDTSHLFTWTDTLSHAPFTATSLRVEIWVNVVVASGGSGQLIFVPTNSDVAATFYDTSSMGASGPSTGLAGEAQYPFTALQETQTSTSDGIRASSVDPGQFDEIFTMCEVTVAIDPALITNIDVTFDGQGNAATNFQIWAESSSGWAQLGSQVAAAADTDVIITRSITANWADYIIGGVFTWGCYQTDSSDLVRVDHLETVIDYVVPDQKFVLEFDYGTTQSSIEPTVSTGGPVADSYDIDLSAYSPGDWAFVSFPIDISGPIGTVLDDSIFGDGGTTWDAVKWYDSSDPADPWKTYRNSPLDDLFTIDNTMGVWIHLVTIGVGNDLTTGIEGLEVATVVTLNAGWNLVGYASTTSADADTSLFGTNADFIAVYNGGLPYLIQDIALPAVYDLEPGNAYWIHVPSPTTWTA